MSSPSLSAAPLESVAINDRGELTLTADNEAEYKPWTWSVLHDTDHIGMLMHLPARLSSREQIGPLENAIQAQGFDYRRLNATSVIDLSDATLGAGLLITRRLSAEKTAQPLVTLVVDAKGQARRVWDLEKGQIHVLLYDCQGRPLVQHHGTLNDSQIHTIVEQIHTALKGPSCGQRPPS